MSTALATQNDQITAGTIGEQSLILPKKREALLMKLNKFKMHNRSAREQKVYNSLTKHLGALFVPLCWSKLSVSKEQLEQLEQQDLNELAVVVFEKSRTCAFVHTGILVCIPVIGWLILSMSVRDVETSDDNCWRNMRYYWWSRRMKNKYGQDFEPSIKEEQK